MTQMAQLVLRYKGRVAREGITTKRGDLPRRPNITNKWLLLNQLFHQKNQILHLCTYIEPNK